MLVPVTPTITAVSKLAAEDPDAAAELVRIGLYEAFCDLAQMHGPRIERVAKRARVAKARELRKSLLLSYVGKRAAGEDIKDVMAAAAELTRVESEWFGKSGLFDPRDHPRGPDGRFMMELKGIDPAERHEQADETAQGLVQEGHVDPGTPVKIIGERNGQELEYPATLGMDGGLVDYAPHPDFDPSHLAVHENHVRSGREQAPAPAEAPAAAPASGAPPAQRPPSTSRGAMDFGQDFIGYNGRKVTPGSFESNLRNVAEPTGSGDRQEGDRRAYRQLSVAGTAVRTMSGGHPAAATVGTIAQVAGELGPQAERVLGPGIRRTAYRYRGTEREPNPQLVREVGDATDLSSAMQAGNHVQVAEGAGRGLAAGTAAYYARGETPRAQRMTPDELDLRVRGDAAVGYFVNRIPDPERTALSIEAGRVPPSQGVIIDRHGDVATEAMGAGSDHYLPFDLKNLKSLQGGQYVRTRAAGGPTTEDVYTGLLGGARQLQVVSNSGVFTVELDPTLRGSRRYSDKARQMITRYSALLGRIHDSQNSSGRGAIYTQDISPTEQSAIRQQAYERAGYDEKLGSQYAAADLEEARQRQMFATPTDEELEETARNKVMSEPTARSMTRPQLETAITDQFHAELRGVQSQRVDRLKLDGEGYYKALQSLQEEFPYFIRNVDYEGLRGFTDERTQRERGQAPLKGRPRATDTGFVPRGDVTAHDGRNRKARASTSDPSDTSGGGGSDASGAAGKPKTPSSSSVGARPFTPVAAMAADPAELTAQLLDNFQTINPIADGSAIPVPEDVKSDSLLGADNAGMWLKAYVTEQGDWGAAAKALVASGTTQQLKKAITAMDVLAKTPTGAEAMGGEGLTESEKKGLATTKATLQRVLASKSKPKKVPGERPLYDPTTSDGDPAHFDELDFDQTKQNLDGWRQAQKGNAPYETAEAELKGKDKNARASHIASKVRAWQATMGFAHEMGGTQPPANSLARTPAQAKMMASNPEAVPEYKHLHQLQLAHTFLTQHEGVTAGAGDAGPKASGVSSDPWSRVPEREKSHELGKRRKVIVHREDSPVAKSLARRRARQGI